jgi:hypothetical protein
LNTDCAGIARDTCKKARKYIHKHLRILTHDKPDTPLAD